MEYITINGIKALQFQCAYSYFNLTVIWEETPLTMPRMTLIKTAKAEDKREQMGANA